METNELIILICQALISLGGIASTILVVFRCFKLLFSKNDKTDKMIKALQDANKDLLNQNEQNSEQIKQLSYQITKVVNSVDVSESAQYEQENKEV